MMTHLFFGADWAMEICLRDVTNAAIDDSWNKSLSWDRNKWLITRHFYWGILKLRPCDSRQLYIWNHLGNWPKFSPFQKFEGTNVVSEDVTTNLVLATYLLCEFDQVTYLLCPLFLHILTENTGLLWGLNDTIFVKVHLKPNIECILLAL